MTKYDYLYCFHGHITNILVNQYGLTYDEIIKVIEENYDINISRLCLRLGQNSTFLDLVME